MVCFPESQKSRKSRNLCGREFFVAFDISGLTLHTLLRLFRRTRRWFCGESAVVHRQRLPSDPSFIPSQVELGRSIEAAILLNALNGRQMTKGGSESAGRSRFTDTPTVERSPTDVTTAVLHFLPCKQCEEPDEDNMLSAGR